jgi:transcriptional regulator with XRE-family HTH domain
MPDGLNHGRVREATNWIRVVITPAQCLEARKLLKWSRDRLAPRCGISAATLGEFENGRTGLHPAARAALRRLLAKAGIEFTDRGEAGVRLREREARLALRTGRTRGRVTSILDGLVRKRALISYRTNFNDRGSIWVPTVSIQVAETADLATVLEEVDKALRPLGVAEIIVETRARSSDGGQA